MASVYLPMGLDSSQDVICVGCQTLSVSPVVDFPRSPSQDKGAYDESSMPLHMVADGFHREEQSCLPAQRGDRPALPCLCLETLVEPKLHS